MSPRALTDQSHSHTSTGVPHSGWVQAVAGSHAYTVSLEYSSRIEPDRHRSLHEESRFEPESRHKGGQSGGETPVPIPNTEVKPTSVPGSTGVRDPLGTAGRRLSTHTGEFPHTRPTLSDSPSGRPLGLTAQPEYRYVAPRWQSSVRRSGLQSRPTPVQIRPLAFFTIHADTAAGIDR